MKIIPLTQDRFALVDDEDFDWLNQYKWYAHKERNVYYAQRRVGNNKEKTTVKMHRLILGLTKNDKLLSDHKNGNGLDNQRYNLRTCTTIQNSGNRQKQKTKTSSKYKGVYWDKRNKRWRAVVRYKITYYLGLFKNENNAAFAYDKAAKKLFGKFAKTNF